MRSIRRATRKRYSADFAIAFVETMVRDSTKARRLDGLRRIIFVIVASSTGAYILKHTNTTSCRLISTF